MGNDKPSLPGQTQSRQPQEIVGPNEDLPTVPLNQSKSEAAIVKSVGAVAVSAALAGAVNVIRNVIGGVKNSFDIRKHLREDATEKKSDDCQN